MGKDQVSGLLYMPGNNQFTSLLVNNIGPVSLALLTLFANDFPQDQAKSRGHLTSTPSRN
jgi:hypothetical protein